MTIGEECNTRSGRLETLIIEAAHRRDLTFAEDFNGRAYALMDIDWIGYFDTLDEVSEYLGISEEIDMCILCENIISTRKELDEWIEESNYDYDMPRHVIYKDTVNHYLYSCVSDENYTEETSTLINYCPVCGKKL